MDENQLKLLQQYVDNLKTEEDVNKQFERLTQVDPNNPFINSVISGDIGPGALQKVVFNPAVRSVAKKYMQKIGKMVSGESSEVVPDISKKIAQAFEEMKHDPTNPEVKAAYDALIKETTDQYKHIKDSGLKVSKIKPNMENPYKSSKEMMSDIQNKHLWYYPTEQGFGTLNKVSDHPLLSKTDEVIDGEPVLANDLLRVVHDYMGHAKEGKSFGPKGEEAAWAEHMKMYSPEAQKALTTETRGQNSWVNFGPKSTQNKLNPQQTVYADQKAGILPDWAQKPNTTKSQLTDDEKIKLYRLVNSLKEE